MQDPNHPDQEPRGGIGGVLKFLAGTIVIVLAVLAILVIADIIDGARFMQLAGTAIAVGVVIGVASGLISLLGGGERRG